MRSKRRGRNNPTMRDDIIVRDDKGNPILDKNGAMSISIKKALGKGYSAGFFTNCKARYRVFEGGRSTKKSYNMLGYEPILKIISQPLRNVVIIRQNDVDHRQSTFERLCASITDLGLDDRFIIRKTPLEIEYKETGQKIVFRGLNNPTGLNSVAFKVGFWTDTYIEEAFEISSFDDFRKVDGSMRGRLPPGYFFQITLCMNAWSKDTWIYEEFFHTRLEDDYDTLDSPDVEYLDYLDMDFIGPFGKGLYLHKSTYKINEFRDPEYDVAAMEMRSKSKDIYCVEYLGMWGNATGAVYPEFNDSLIHEEQWFNKIDQATGRPVMDYYDFAIGIDTGLSDGEGRKITVKKGEKVEERVKSATAMALCAVTSDFSKMVVLDEYFHSNGKYAARYNTDNNDTMTEPQLLEACANTIIMWREHYGYQGRQRLMKGRIRIYIDSADIGFRQSLELKLREKGLYDCECYASTKLPIQSRVDFAKTMMAYGEYLVCDKCKNLIREIKNARRGDKGEARQPGDDHIQDAADYGFASLLSDLRRYKTFKLR